MKLIFGILFATFSQAFAVDRPIIGILSQEVSSSLNEFGITGTYIASSYVKWVEAAGARAVPIIVNSDQDFTQMFQYLNGLLIPGGAVSLSDSPYSRVGSYFLEQAMASTEMLEVLATEKVTSNFHHWCLTMENFTKYEMDSFWNVISTNEDINGMEFISMFEAKDYPIYGVQFHPEKNNYEWAPKLESIPHSRNAVKVSNYFADFFVEEARKSSHTFPSREIEEEYLIYNWNPTYTGQEAINYGFQTIYVFPEP